jgi:hypothetical protein
MIAKLYQLYLKIIFLKPFFYAFFTNQIFLYSYSFIFKSWHILNFLGLDFFKFLKQHYKKISIIWLYLKSLFHAVIFLLKYSVDKICFLYEFWCKVCVKKKELFPEKKGLIKVFLYNLQYYIIYLFIL